MIPAPFIHWIHYCCWLLITQGQNGTMVDGLLTLHDFCLINYINYQPFYCPILYVFSSQLSLPNAFWCFVFTHIVILYCDSFGMSCRCRPLREKTCCPPSTRFGFYLCVFWSWSCFKRCDNFIEPWKCYTQRIRWWSPVHSSNPAIHSIHIHSFSRGEWLGPLIYFEKVQYIKNTDTWKDYVVCECHPSQ